MKKSLSSLLLATVFFILLIRSADDDLFAVRTYGDDLHGAAGLLLDEGDIVLELLREVCRSSQKA